MTSRTADHSTSHLCAEKEYLIAKNTRISITDARPIWRQSDDSHSEDICDPEKDSYPEGLPSTIRTGENWDY